MPGSISPVGALALCSKASVLPWYGMTFLGPVFLPEECSAMSKAIVPCLGVPGYGDVLGPDLSCTVCSRMVLHLTSLCIANGYV